MDYTFTRENEQASSIDMTDPRNAEYVRLATLRKGLQLEMRGMRRKGKSCYALLRGNGFKGNRQKVEAAVRLRMNDLLAEAILSKDEDNRLKHWLNSIVNAVAKDLLDSYNVNLNESKRRKSLTGEQIREFLADNIVGMDPDNVYKNPTAYHGGDEGAARVFAKLTVSEQEGILRVLFPDSYETVVG